LPEEEKISIYVTKLRTIDSKIPTTFVPLAPEKLLFDDNADVLVGLFHIMWEDMPRRRTYKLCLKELVSSFGDYSGSSLVCGSAGNYLEKLADSTHQNE
jgi:hypothetical protein